MLCFPSSVNQHSFRAATDMGSQNHRMVGVRRDLGDHLVQTPCQSRFTWSRLHRASSRQVLNISREGVFLELGSTELDTGLQMGPH